MAPAILGLVLDSSVLVDAERAKRTTSDVIQHIREEVGDVPIIICALTVAELAHGIHRANSPERRQRRRDDLGWPCSFASDADCHALTEETGPNPIDASSHRLRGLHLSKTVPINM